MKKVININFQGRVVPIEEAAYDILKQYVESLRRFFANEEGRDEIINDIEGRIAELFGETLKKGSTCITVDDVNVIIASMGRPEDFDDEEANVKSQLGGEQKQENKSSYQSSTQQTYTTNADGARRLYRDENHKFLGGVCSGIANYFAVDKMIIRIIFILLSSVLFIPYLILWVAVPGTSSVVIGSQRKRLFRDNDDKVIAGVCSGLAQYFGVNIWLPRILFLIPFFSFAFRFGHWGLGDFPDFLSFSFSPASLIIYIILWLVLPEAKTSADKLEMKGEKVDLESIKNTIQNDMEGFSDRAKKFGEEVSDRAKEFGRTATDRSREFSREAANISKRGGSTFGNAVGVIVKMFVYFIVGCVLFFVVIGLFTLGTLLTSLTPSFNYVIDNGWQTIFLWGTLILFVWLPVIGIITFIIRRLAKMRGNSGVIRYTFLSLWLIGLFCFVGLIASLSNEFRYKNHSREETIYLNNPGVNKLEVNVERFGKYYETNWFDIEPFTSFSDDTAFVRNVRIRVVKSNNDSFSVKLVRLSNGKTKDAADELANKIDYKIYQSDTSLILGKGIGINKTNKFRNQHVIVTIAVPVGKRILIKERAGWDKNVNLSFGRRNDWNFWEDDQEEGAQRWRSDVEYVMTKDGLERTDRQSDDDDYNNRRRNNNDDVQETIRRSQESREELQKKMDEKKKEMDEKQKELDEINKELQKPLPAIDSTKYKYQPEKPKAATVPKAVVQVSPVSFSTDTVLMKFTI